MIKIDLGMVMVGRRPSTVVDQTIRKERSTFSVCPDSSPYLKERISKIAIPSAIQLCACVALHNEYLPAEYWHPRERVCLPHNRCQGCAA